MKFHLRMDAEVKARSLSQHGATFSVYYSETDSGYIVVNGMLNDKKPLVWFRNGFGYEPDHGKP